MVTVNRVVYQGPVDRWVTREKKHSLNNTKLTSFDFNIVVQSNKCYTAIYRIVNSHNFNLISYGLNPTIVILLSFF